tara:strand:- start:43 stop:600 length:558 start_codon:yes stop_codon:yes gene_type:complete
MYDASVEQQKFLSYAAQENAAFEKLIREKANLVISDADFDLKKQIRPITGMDTEGTSSHSSSLCSSLTANDLSLDASHISKLLTTSGKDPLEVEEFLATTGISLTSADGDICIEQLDVKAMDPGQYLKQVIMQGKDVKSKKLRDDVGRDRRRDTGAGTLKSSVADNVGKVLIFFWGGEEIDLLCN